MPQFTITVSHHEGRVIVMCEAPGNRCAMTSQEVKTIKPNSVECMAATVVGVALKKWSELAWMART